MGNDLDLDIYNEAKEHAEDLLSTYGKRNKEFEDYEKMFLLDWQNKPDLEGIKITISPDPRNAILGVVRLMTMTDPIFSVPDNIGEKFDSADRLEQAAARWWLESGKVAGIPVHRDAVLSGALYGEVHIAVSSTQDMLDYLKGVSGSNKSMKAVIKRAERLVQRTPFLFEVWNPKSGYPEFDSLGLSAYYRKVCLLYTSPSPRDS